MNDLSRQKRTGLEQARKAYQQEGEIMDVCISVRFGADWQHYQYRYDPVTDSLIQDKAS